MYCAHGTSVQSFVSAAGFYLPSRKDMKGVNEKEKNVGTGLDENDKILIRWNMCVLGRPGG